MGRPAHIKPLPTGANRRDFFKRSSSAAVAITALPMLSLAGHAQAATSASVFQHGVASGDPLSDRVILWTRVTPATAKTSITVTHVVALDPAFTQVVVRGSSKTNVDRDYTVKIDQASLRPHTTYYYRFTAEGVDSPVGRTKTLPVGTVERLRMAVVSCSNFAYGYFNVYRRVAQRTDLDVVVHLGDYLYEYGTGQYGSVRVCEPASEIVTLTDYRTRHAQYKRDADAQEMHRQHPMIAIWDDHETANNAFNTGAENHQPGTEGAWTARVAAAMKAYYEWMPVRSVDTTDLRKNNRSFQFGNLVDLVMLEERLGGRSEQLGTNIASAAGYFTQTGAYADPARQLLGAEEEAWLAAKLRTSPAKWKLIGQGVMFAQLKVVGAPNAAGGGVFLNSDQWDGYQPARNRVYDVLKGNAGTPGVGNVVVLTGDIHSAWAADLSQDPNNPDTATGGYNPATGEGSTAVEFVGTSVTSPGVNDPTGAVAASLMQVNPHFKHIDLMQRGYMLLDIDAQRALCEFWNVDTVASLSNIETFSTAFQTQDGANHLTPAAQTTPRANPPLPAP